jgi:hypothetical protein
VSESTAARSQAGRPASRRPLLVGALALAAVVGLAAAGLFVLPDWVASNIEVQPDLLSIRPAPAEGGGDILDRVMRGRLRLEGSVWVRNRTILDLEIERVAWRARVRGREVANGLLEPGPHLAADRETQVTLTGDIAVIALGLAAADVLKVGKADVDTVVAVDASCFGIRAHVERVVRGFDLRIDASGVQDIANEVVP